MPKLYLVRHAEPERSDSLLGSFDAPLTAQGRLTRISLPEPAAAVYTSPLIRARETALQLAPEIVVIDGLREISYGEWDGLRWADIERRDPELARAKLNDWFHVTAPNGEPWDEFRVRVRSALDRVLAGPMPAVVIGHSAVNSIIHEALIGQDPFEFRQAHGEVFEYEF